MSSGNQIKSCVKCEALIFAIVPTFAVKGSATRKILCGSRFICQHLVFSPGVAVITLVVVGMLPTEWWTDISHAAARKFFQFCAVGMLSTSTIFSHSLALADSSN